jgi:hypothetical protein
VTYAGSARHGKPKNLLNTILTRIAWGALLAGILLFPSQLLKAQTTVPGAGLVYLLNTPMPNWSTAGGSWDLFAFNPYTRIMYVADRTNHSIDAIDTRNNNLVGVLQTPSLGNTNGVLVAPDLQQLVATDGKTNVFVYDLRLPQGLPDTYSIPGITGGTDALDYDPLNHTVYVINGAANFMTGIDLLYKRIVSQFSLPGTTELMRWSPVDGLIYQIITGGSMGIGVAGYDPAKNNLAHFYPLANCAPHGIEIDAPTNTALIGCGTNGPQQLMSLKDGSILKTFPDVTGADLLAYNPNLRRFYAPNGSNVSTTTGCPTLTNKTTTPIIGVISPLGTGSLAGVTCSSRSSHAMGVDPIQNVLYVAGLQYPADPASTTTGVAGIQLFYDPAPLGQPLTTTTKATLAPLGHATVQGSIRTSPMGRSVRMDATLQGVSGLTAIVNVTTTVGNESMECSINYATLAAYCGGGMVGDPLIGGIVLVGVDGVPVASGTITAP